MKKKKRIFSVLLCALLAASLAGCRANITVAEEDPTQDSADATQAAAPAADNANAAAGNGTAAAADAQAALPEQIRLYEGGYVISPGARDAKEIPFYVGLFDRSGTNSCAGAVYLTVRLVNSRNEEVYNGYVTLQASDFDCRWVETEGRSVYMSRISVPAEDVLVGQVTEGTIEVTAENDAGQTLPKATLATSMLPANRTDRITVVSMEAERLPPPNQAINVYVTFYYDGPEDIDLFSCYYQQYTADGTQIFTNDLWQFYNNVKAGSEFTMLFRVDPSYDPDSFVLKQYMFAEDDPDKPGNTNTYWADDFDETHSVHID